VLTEVGPCDLLAEEGLADVRAEVLYAGHGPDLPACAGDAPDLLVERAPGLGDPVHQEATLLERGEEVLAQPGQDRQPGEPDDAHGQVRGPRPAHHARQEPAVD